MLIQINIPQNILPEESQIDIYLRELQKAIIEHPNSVKLTRCALSNGAMYLECVAELQRIHNDIIGKFNLKDV